MTDDDPYLYPGTNVLRNKLGITDTAKLDEIERDLVTARYVEGAPTGRFGLAHLYAIHRHLFQDLYAWAGQVRTVEIAKGDTRFMFRQFIHTGMADVQRRVVASGYLRAMTAAAFAAAAGEILGDVNHVHPFREGNGRTQLVYLTQLARQAGHEIDVRCLERSRWIEASRAANRGEYGLMRSAIAGAIVNS